MEIFQTFEHNGKVLQLAKYESGPPAPTATKHPSIKAPGAGKFEIGTITLSSPTTAAGEEITFTAQINGKNISYIYFELLLQDKSLNQFYGPVASEYIQADKNKTIGGVSHPVWDDSINLTVRLNPSLRLLTDGVDSAFGFFIPANYGNSESRLDGLYTPASGSDPRRARITFDSAGQIVSVVAYKEKGRTAPHALTFEHGDQFAPFVQVLTQPAEEKQAWKSTKGLSTPLTFKGQPFQQTEEPLMPADYLIGLLVQDLDGGFVRKYAPLTISA